MLPAPRLWAHRGQCPMDVPASFWVWSVFFSHDILAPINPFDFSLFEAQGLDVFQHTLKSESDVKTLEPVQKFKTLIHTPWKGFFIWYADNDWLYYVYLLTVSPFAIDSVLCFPGARLNFQRGCGVSLPGCGMLWAACDFGVKYIEEQNKHITEQHTQAHTYDKKSGLSPNLDQKIGVWFYCSDWLQEHKLFFFFLQYENCQNIKNDICCFGLIGINCFEAAFCGTTAVSLVWWQQHPGYILRERDGWGPRSHRILVGGTCWPAPLGVWHRNSLCSPSLSSHCSVGRRVWSGQAGQGTVAGKMQSFQQFGSILISVFCALLDFPFSSPALETVCISGSVSRRQGTKKKKHNPIRNPST